jgi:type IV fimbrial biogenesis protein FimT
MLSTRVSNQQGLTLIELVIVVALIGVLVGIAIPIYIGQIPQSRLNGAARQVMADLMLARRQAVSETRRVRVYFPDNQRYKICYDADGDGIVGDCEGNGKIKNIQATYYGVTITANKNPIFHPRGTVAEWTTITLSNASGSRDVTISSAGRIRIRRR